MEGFIGFLVVLLGLFVIGTFFSGLFTVPTAKAAVVQRFGKFVRVAGAGLNFKVPWIEQVVAKVDLRVQQLDVKMETKTKDNVFVAIPVSIQYHVLPEAVYEAYYKLSDPKEQIGSFVFNVILGHVPKMNLDEAFEQQNAIATAVKQELDGVMAGFGYGIVKALVTDIIPDPKVKAAMNDINAARREQEAANARGEAEKILKVKQAEAEAMSKQLQGQHRQSAQSHYRGTARIGGDFQGERRGYHRQGRDDAGPADPILRHAQRNRRVIPLQHHHDAP